MQTIPFTKMHGCGNDYVYIDQFDTPLIRDPAALAVRLSERHRGIGSDGLILVCPPRDGANHGRMRMFNADGSEGKMCGNGIRCVGKFLFDHGYATAPVLRIETAAGLRVVRLRIHDGICDGASVDMGMASHTGAEIPVNACDTQHIPVIVDGQTILLCAVSMGNPHAVLFTDVSPETLPIAEIAGEIAAYRTDRGTPLFPEGVNVEFIRVRDAQTLEMRVYERGSGETMACGTGACAAVCAAIRNGYSAFDTPVTVHLRGGDVQVTVQPNWQVTLTGPAETAFVGTFQSGDEL